MSIRKFLTICNNKHTNEIKRSLDMFKKDYIMNVRKYTVNIKEINANVVFVDEMSTALEKQSHRVLYMMEVNASVDKYHYFKNNTFTGMFLEDDKLNTIKTMKKYTNYDMNNFIIVSFDHDHIKCINDNFYNYTKANKSDYNVIHDDIYNVVSKEKGIKCKNLAGIWLDFYGTLDGKKDKHMTNQLEIYKNCLKYYVNIGTFLAITTCVYDKRKKTHNDCMLDTRAKLISALDKFHYDICKEVRYGTRKHMYYFAIKITGFK